MTPFSFRTASILLGTILLTTAARADFVTHFSSPPYKLNESIIGIDGWEPRGVAVNPSNAGLAPRVVALRWDDYKNVLLLRGAQLKNAFSPTTTEHVKVTMRIAITGPDRGNLHQTRILIGGSPFGEIIYDAGVEGGLGFGSGNARSGKIIVPRSQMKMNSFYTFTINIDYGAKTYDYTVTGESRDGSPFKVEEKGLPVEKGTFLEGLQILSGTMVSAYISELSIESL